MKQGRHQQSRQKLSLQSLVLLILSVAMVVLSVGCFGTWQWLAHLLQSQRAAERWQGDDDLAFSQISCFLPADQKIGLEEVAEFRGDAMKKLQEASLDITGNRQLMLDAWSTTAKLYTSGEHGRGEASVIAVGGNYFDFHPLTLLSGDYIRQSDLMKDRIVLGENVAWLLFGGTNLAGMTMELNGTPFMIAGVVAQENDFASRKANSDTLDLYMSYDKLLEFNEETKINCYEVLLANPVKNFALNAVKEKFPIGRGEIVCNTTRYGWGEMTDLILHFGSRGTETSGAVLPYWENAARRTEDWGALCCFLGTVLLIFPMVMFVLWAIQAGKRFKIRMDDILPEMKDYTEEAVRKRQRKFWERRHGVHEKTPEKPENQKEPAGSESPEEAQNSENAEEPRNPEKPQ